MLKNYLEECHKIAKSRGGACLSTKYINAHTKLLWKCSNDHLWEANLNNIKNGQWCPKCSRIEVAKKQGAGISTCVDLAKARGGVCLSMDYINSKTPISWRCAAGHQWQAPFTSIKRGSWCPTCASGIGERIVREFFEQLFRSPFPKSRPTWLRNVRGNKMELDGYAKSLGLAFEHQGQQHFGHVAKFYKSNMELNQRIADDEQKRRLCRERGVILVEVPEVPTTLPYEGIKDFIERRLKDEELPPPVRTCLKSFSSISVSYLKAYAIQPLLAIERVAQLKGGKLVSQYYLGIFHPLEFSCEVGHVFKKQPVNILHNNQWCPFCAKIRKQEFAKEHRKSIDALRRLAEKRGGTLLSGISLGAHKKHEWSCAKGHTFHASPANVLMGKWCPKCSRIKASSKIQMAMDSRFAEILKERGGLLLSESYVKAKAKVRIRCNAGHEWVARPDSISRGSWCPKCGGSARLSIKSAQELAARHEGTCISSHYINAHSLLEWRCKVGHEFKKPYTKVQQGQWCSECNKKIVSPPNS